MSTETNKDVVRRYREIHNTDQLDQLGDILAPDYKTWTLMPGLPPGLETYKQIHQMTKLSFPDLHVTTDDLIAEGDKVVERWTQTQTHSGAAFMGLPPSGKKAVITGISIYRLKDGRIVEHWANMDFFGVMVQLGAIQPPGM